MESEINGFTNHIVEGVEVFGALTTNRAGTEIIRNEEGEAIAKYCSACKKIHLREKMAKSNKTPDGMGSRCSEYFRVKTKERYTAMREARIAESEAQREKIRQAGAKAQRESIREAESETKSEKLIIHLPKSYWQRRPKKCGLTDN